MNFPYSLPLCTIIFKRYNQNLWGPPGQLPTLPSPKSGPDYTSMVKQINKQIKQTKMNTKLWKCLYTLDGTLLFSDCTLGDLPIIRADCCRHSSLTSCGGSSISSCRSCMAYRNSRRKMTLSCNVASSSNSEDCVT